MGILPQVNLSAEELRRYRTIRCGNRVDVERDDVNGSSRNVFKAVHGG